MARVSETNGAREHEHELFEQSRIPTVLLDVNLRAIRAVNTATEQLLGLPREQIIGRPATDFLTEKVVDETLRQRGLRGVAFRTIRAVEGREGRRTAEITVTPTSERGVVFVQLIDLTDLLFEDALERMTAHGGVDPERVLDASPVATFVVDLANREITRINPSGTKLLGSSVRQIVGHQVTDFSARPEDLAHLLTSVSDDASGATHSASTILHTAEGDEEVEITAVGLLDTPSVVLHIVPSTAHRPVRRSRSRRPIAISPDVDRRRRGIEVACGAMLASLGSVVLVIGWWLGVDFVTHLAPDLASMKANTAAGFLILGVALTTPNGGRGVAVRTTLFLALVAIGSSTSLEYLLDLDFGIDELLADETDLVATSSPGRMGLNTALCFAAIGVGAIVSAPGRGRRQTAAGQVAIILAGGLAFLALLAYAYGASDSRGLASSTEMALHTAVAVVVATFGLLSTQLDRGVIAPIGAPLAGGRYARRILPIGVGIVFASGLVAKALTRRDARTDPDLSLAIFGLVVAGSLLVVVLAVTRRSNALDARADRTRRDLSTVMAAFADLHYRIDANGDAIAVTGTTSTRRTPVASLVPAAIRERLDTALSVSRSEGRVTELTFTPDDGEGRRELRVAPLASQEVAVSIRDTSELAAARDALAELTESLEDDVRARTAELENTNEELERSNSDLEQFAYLASHDLQEPLRMVSTFVDKLADRIGDDLDERSAQYVTFAVDGAQRMADLIDGLLQYSRAGRNAGTPGLVELADVIPGVLQGLSERISDQNATIDIAGDLPDVWVDEVLLRQILQNLLGNALKFIAPERSARVWVDARRVGSTVEIGVADNGVGIPREFHEHVFLMFRRLHARTSYAGTGIGLSLVERLVESQGGTVWIDDDHGPDGVRFVFTLPAAPPSNETTP